jgi:hypothetical protein
LRLQNIASALASLHDNKYQNNDAKRTFTELYSLMSRPVSNLKFQWLSFVLYSIYKSPLHIFDLTFNKNDCFAGCSRLLLSHISLLLAGDEMVVCLHFKLLLLPEELHS